jgi:DNA-binding NtrC family response regulator
VILTQGSTMTLDDLRVEAQHEKRVLNSNDYFVLPANATLTQIEKEAILQTLQRSEGNRQAASRHLAIGPATLYRKLKEYQIP